MTQTDGNRKQENSKPPTQTSPPHLPSLYLLMLPLTLLFFLAYGMLLAYYTLQWYRVPEFFPVSPKQKRRFSVLIAARNEENNIGGLLMALQGQQYPADLIEVIVIDDGSTDRTAQIVQQYPFVTLLSLTEKNGGTGKKQALTTGIRSARHEWIVATDADCIPPTGWIDSINDFLDQQEGLACVVGPVTLSPTDGNLLHAFQRYDHLMFQGITTAAVGSGQHALGNGANLCYRKDSFEAVGGFEGIDQVASGDDVLLIEKFMKQYPGKVAFLKSNRALVKTRPCQTWKELWQQRLRWISKAGTYKNFRLQLAQWITGVFNLALLLQTLFCFWQSDQLKPTVSLWVFKAILEWFLIGPVASLYRERKNFGVFLFLQPLHVFYLVTVGLVGQGRKYKWKGRTVR